jgi:hypothetical protein
MAAPQGIIRFPGVRKILGGEFTLTHGISPSVATIRVVNDPAIAPRVGTLTLGFGRIRIRFPDSLLDVARISVDGGTATLRIFDRRWKWQWGVITGRHSDRTPQDLAIMLLRAMGERRFSVTELPNWDRPSVDWVSANPAQELQALCEQRGCRIVLDTFNRVMIRRVGRGRRLPQRNVISSGLSIDPPDRPDSVQVTTGPARFQARFDLEAIAEDVDGKIKPIGQVSYLALGAWQTGWPNSFVAIAEQSGDEARKLALKTLWRWYRIHSVIGGKTRWDVPGYPGKVTERDQLLPISEDLLDPVLGTAAVRGSFWPGGQAHQNTSSGTDYDGDFTIKGDTGLVVFNDPVFRFDSDKEQFRPADINVEASFGIKHHETRQPIRFIQQKRIPGPRTNTGPEVIRRDEIEPEITARYDGGKLSRVETNDDLIFDEIDRALLAATAKYVTQISEEKQYAGLLAINPDGAIQQVSWSVGDSGARTRASRNMEFAAPRHGERRRKEKVNQLLGASN